MKYLQNERMGLLGACGHYLVLPGQHFFAASKKGSQSRNPVDVFQTLWIPPTVPLALNFESFSDQQIKTLVPWLAFGGCLWELLREPCCAFSCHCSVLSSPFSDSAQGVAGLPWDSCTPKDLLISTF